MTRKILLFSLLCLVLNTFAQSGSDQRKIDSLVQLLPKMKQDSKEVLRLNVISFLYQRLDSRKGLKYAKQALALAQKLEDNDGIAESYRMVGYNYAIESNEKAITYYHKALKFTKKPDVLANLYMGLGLVYTYQSDYKNAMKYDLMALKLAEEVKDVKQVVGLQLNIGIIYYDLGNFEKAREFYEKALAGNIKLGDKSSIAYSYGNLGNVYSALNQNAKAISYYEKAIAISIELGDVMSQTLGYSAIADIYFQQKQFEKALEAINKALIFSRQMNDMRNLSNATAISGDILLELAKQPENKARKAQLLQMAIANFNESTAILAKQQSIKDVYANYEQLAKASVMLGDFKQAYDYSNLSIKYKDSIFNEDTKETIKNLEDKRAIELRDKQIELNKATLKNKEKEQYLYIIGIAFLLILAALIFIQSRNRQKTNNKLQQLNGELDTANKVKARFFSILNHDLRSPVANLINFLHLQKDSPELLDDEGKKRMEAKTISSAENLLDSMEDILLWSKGQMENFTPDPKNIKIDSLFEDLSKHFYNVSNVSIRYENAQNLTVFSDENYLKTILRNLTGNAIKALEKTPDATIILRAFETNGRTSISVTDNGPGGTTEKFKALYDETQIVGIKTGLGLHLIRDLAKAINAKITVDSQPGSGTTFTVLFQ